MRKSKGQLQLDLDFIQYWALARWKAKGLKFSKLSQLFKIGPSVPEKEREMWIFGMELFAKMFKKIRQMTWSVLAEMEALKKAKIRMSIKTTLSLGLFFSS